MFNSVVDLIKSFGRLFIWWVVVQPWELGLRVRLGKTRTKLEPGVHFRIPYFDSVYKQSTRLRFSTLRPQTVTTADGQTLTMSGVIGYTIIDMDKLYDSLHQAEDGIRSLSQRAIAQYVHTHLSNKCDPESVQNNVETNLNLKDYGLRMHSVCLTTYAKVRVYRLIMDNQENIWEDCLNTRVEEHKVQ